MAGKVRFLLPAMMAALCAAEEPGQSAAKTYNGSAYVRFATGACAHLVPNVALGGGAEGFLWKGLSLGGDFGYYRFVGRRGGDGFGAGSFDIGYHFVDRVKPGRVDPFLRTSIAGAGIAAGGVAGAGSLGGGVNYWFKPRMALRTEVRMHVFSEEAMVLFHIGLTFR